MRFDESDHWRLGDKRWEIKERDADFIANARQDLPAALDEIERLNHLLDSVQVSVRDVAEEIELERR